MYLDLDHNRVFSPPGGRHFTLSDWPDRQCLQTKGSKFIGEHFHATTTIHWHRCRTRKLSYSGRCSANMGTSTFNIKFIILTLIRWRLLMHNRVRWTLTTKPNLIFSLRDKYLSVSKDNNKRRESDNWHNAVCYIIAAAIMAFAKAN